MTYVFLGDGFEEVEALTVVDILRRANIHLQTVSVHSRKNNRVTGRSGITVEADVNIEDLTLESAQMYVLPGGLGGVESLKASDRLKDMIQEGNKNGAWICAICAGPSILGEWGYLKGEKAVCYPGFEEKLEGAEVVQENVCVSGHFITSRGMGTSIDFSLALVQALKDDETAKKIAADIIYDYKPILIDNL